ncbi:RNA-directed DNA polymerase, eukaryota [Tanacetum coccineum]
MAEKIRHDGLSSSYRRPPRGGAEEDQQSLFQARVTDLDVPTRWVKVIPIKINIFAWRVFLDKLPTQLDLSLRGVNISFILLPLCDALVESSSHLFFTCPLVCQVRSKVSRLWELDDPVLHSYDEWLTWFNNIRLSKNLKALFERARRYAELAAALPAL